MVRLPTWQCFRAGGNDSGGGGKGLSMVELKVYRVKRGRLTREGFGEKMGGKSCFEFNRNGFGGLPTLAPQGYKSPIKMLYMVAVHHMLHSVGLTCLEHTDLSINAQSTEVDALPVNDDNVNANEDNADFINNEDDVVTHVLDDDDVEVSDDDEVNPSTNVEEVLSSDDSDDDN
ncbi:hypothetical protein Tco_0603755 [Tanacetum coccineum]